MNHVRNLVATVTGTKGERHETQRLAALAAYVPAPNSAASDYPRPGTTSTSGSHAKNKIAGRFIPFSVLGFWDKNAGICAGAMPYRRDFPATTGI